MNMNVRFNLKNKSEDRTLIFLFYRYGKKRLKYSTGHKIEPTKWSDKKQRVKGYTAEAKKINQWLDDLQSIFEKTITELRLSGETPETAKVKKIVLQQLGKEECTQHDTLFEFWLNHIEERKKANAPKDTIKNIKTAYSRVREFNSSLNYDDIDMNFYYSFLEYCNEKNYSSNYIWKILSMLKMIMNKALSRGLHTSVWFKTREFKKTMAPTDKTALAEFEILKIYNTKFENVTHKNVADSFVFACFTGIRSSDWGKVSSDSVTGNEIQILNIKTDKTGIMVSIPLNKVCIEILERNNGKLIIYAQQYTNRVLKQVCQLAGLTDKTTEVISAKTNKTKIGEKWEFVTTHTARRSFVTNCKLKGIQDSEIMKMTGHKTTKAFTKYDKVTLEQNAKRLAKETNFLQVGLKKVI